MANPDALLDAAVDALFTALNAPDAAAVRRRCTDAGWTALRPHLQEGPGRFTRFPAALIEGDRAAIHGVTTATGDDRLEPLWLGFVHEGTAWFLDAAFPDRSTARAWLHRAPGEDDLHTVVRRIAEAVHDGAEDALRALSTEAGWAASATTPARLLRAAAQGDVQLAPLGPPRIAGDRAAVHLAWVVDGRPADTIWLCLRREAGWRLEGQVETDDLAALWLRGLTTGVPSWGTLPEDPDAAAFVEAALRHVGTDAPPPPGSDPDAWAALLTPSDPGLTPRVGEARALPSLKRALVHVGFYAPDDPEFSEEDRWALLEEEDGRWRLRAVRYLPGLGTLLEGLSLGLPGDEAPPPGKDPDDAGDPAVERPRPEPGPPGDPGQALQAALGSLLAGMAGTSGRAEVDAAFLEQKVPDLAAALFGGLARALAPDTGQPPAASPPPAAPPHRDDVSAAEADAGQRTVEVGADLGTLLGSLLAGAVQKPPAGDADEPE